MFCLSEILFPFDLPLIDRVKLGVDHRTGETVAIKIMYKENMSARANQQLRREITSMKNLNHPNILRLKEVHEVRKVPIFLTKPLGKGSSQPLW